MQCYSRLLVFYIVYSEGKCEVRDKYLLRGWKGVRKRGFPSPGHCRTLPRFPEAGRVNISAELVRFQSPRGPAVGWVSLLHFLPTSRVKAIIFRVDCIECYLSLFSPYVRNFKIPLNSRNTVCAMAFPRKFEFIVTGLLLLEKSAFFLWRLDTAAEFFSEYFGS